MTKLRDPVTFEDAIVRIAAVIGWPAMADACGVSERTVRNWSDPDTPERLPAACGVLLDAAYRAGGGDGAPVFETHGHQLKVVEADRFADAAEICRRTMESIKEGSDAHVALVALTRPGATAQDKAIAIRETQEAITVLTNILALVTKGAGPIGTDGEDAPRGGAQS